MDVGLMMPANSEKQLSDEQSRSVAALVREALARRRISRQQLADQAKISISTLEKALAGRRPFTLATTIRLEEALGLPLAQGECRRRPRGRAGDHARAGRARLLLAPRRVVHRGHLPDVTPVLRRPGGHLRLPHRNLLGCRHVEPRSSGSPNGSTPSSPRRVASPCPISPATSTSSRTGRGNIASSSSVARPSTAKCSAS